MMTRLHHISLWLRSASHQTWQQLAIICRFIFTAIVVPVVTPFGKTIKYVIKAVVPDSAGDASALLGVVFLAVGLGMERTSYGFIATGVLLFAIAILPKLPNRRGGS